MGSSICFNSNTDKIELLDKVFSTQKFVYQYLPNLVNPYQPQQSGEQMSREVHYQIHLKSQGIHEDYILHPDYYKICALCSSEYGPNLKTIVLQCGHFLCQTCLLRTANCLVHTCGAPIVLLNNKVFVFNKKTVQPKLHAKRINYYDLIVNVSQNTHAQTVEVKVQGQQKFSQIFQKNPRMRQMLVQGSPTFVIKSYSKMYNDIKDKTMDELSGELRLQSTQSGKKISQSTMQQKKVANDMILNKS